MAFKKQTLAQIAALLKISEADLIAAAASTDEVDIAIPTDVQVFTAAELTARDKNKKDEGIGIGKELIVKDIKKETGLNYTDEGSLDPVRLVKELTTKAVTDAKIEPDKKVNLLNEQVSALQKQLAEKETAIATISTQAQEKMFDADLRTWMPSNRKTDLMQDAEFAQLVKANLTFERDASGVIVSVSKGGQVLRDEKTQNPIAPADAVKSLFTERKWLAESTPNVEGRGAGNSNVGAAGGSKYTKLSELKNAWIDAGKNPISPEFQEAYVAEVKANPAFENDMA